MTATLWTNSANPRRTFIGGSDARIITGDGEAVLDRLWPENARERTRRVAVPARALIQVRTQEPSSPEMPAG